MLDSFLVSVSQKIINPLIALMFALAVAYFLYGMLEFLMNQTNDEKKTSGKSHMLWGVVGMTIMMGVFFLMNMILATFGITDVTVTPNGDIDVQLQPYTPPTPNNLGNNPGP